MVLSMPASMYTYILMLTVVIEFFLKQAGFKTTGTGPEMRLQLQSLIFDMVGSIANDLDDGDSGLEGRATNDGGRRKRKVEGSGEGGNSKGKGKKRKRANIVSLSGWE